MKMTFSAGLLARNCSANSRPVTPSGMTMSLRSKAISSARLRHSSSASRAEVAS